VTGLRAALAAPFRLAPIDLLAAIVIAVIALGFVAAPAFSQAPGSPTPSAAASAAAPSPSPSAGPTASPILVASAEPSAAPVPAASAALPPNASRAPAEATPSPVHSLAPGANSEEDPCAPRPTPDPAATPNPDATALPPHNLCPAQPNGADPLALLSWAFTPIFQAIFLGLAFLYSITGDIGIAIILLTIIIRILLIPVFRAQIVSQRRMQMLQPELRAISTKYKGDRAKISAEQMQLYRDRGVNPASGCLPALLQLVLLLPMYQVFSQGLTAPDISSMLSVFGVQVVNIQCQDPGNPYAPCINPDVPWLAWLPVIDSTGFHMPGYPGGMPANLPEVFISLAFLFGLGLSLLALASAILQLVQTRMMTTPSDDPQQRAQQRIFLLMPAFSLLYGGILPAGLFIYWITTTVFSIVQQFLINGYGGLFPLFGWTPGFAKDHTPRFPVKMPEPKPKPATAGAEATQTTRSATESAAGTIKPARRRSSRRGRRR
jgi:YidC/Oxa1 family membrane protein insertase